MGGLAASIIILWDAPCHCAGWLEGGDLLWLQPQYLKLHAASVFKEQDPSLLKGLISLIHKGLVCKKDMKLRNYKENDKQIQLCKNKIFFFSENNPRNLKHKYPSLWK